MFVTQSLFSFLLLAVISLHWVACAWGMIAGADTAVGNWAKAGGEKPDGNGAHVPEVVGATEAMWGKGNTWITRLLMDTSSSVNLNTKPWQLYVISLDYAVSAMAMSYGESQPNNDGERMFTVLAMVTMGAMNAYLVGGVCSMLTEGNTAQADFRRQMDMLKRFMSDGNFPAPIRADATAHFEYCRELFKNRSYQTLLENMPHSLRVRSEIHLIEAVFQKVGLGGRLVGGCQGGCAVLRG
jgi:hypothetical protein